MKQSIYKSWTAMNKVICLEKPKQFAVNFDMDENVWVYSRPDAFVIKS